MAKSKSLKIIFYLFVGVIFVYVAIFYLPAVFISQEGDKCLVDSNCLRIKPVCEEINQKMALEPLGKKEPMCINYRCKCEWQGNLLHFK